MGKLRAALESDFSLDLSEVPFLEPTLLKGAGERRTNSEEWLQL